ncbi:MAG TPA: terminase family protein [Leptospiraceae bacterium]|nr:terminase family protein [Leptospiraceae bacterium]
MPSQDDILRELARRKEEEKCRFFVPNGKQEQAIRMFDKNMVSIFSGGNGAGKTYLMVNVMANIIWGPQTEWFESDLFKSWRFPKRLRIGTESGNVKETGAVDLAIKEWWPKGRYQGIKGGLPYISQYVTDNGWVIDKMSYEQDTKEWESATLGGIFFDEPPPKDKYMASVARLRKGGVLGIFMTPLTQSAWIMDELIDSHTNQCGLVYADMEDNCKTHGIRGTLEHSHIENMIKNMDPDEIDARVHGKAMHLSSVILGKAFKREFHIAPENKTMPAGAQRFMVVDPARGKPWAIGWGWVDIRGQIVFDKEYPEADWLRCRESALSIKDYADIIRRDEFENGPVAYRIIDRHFANSRNDYGTTLKQDLEEKFGLEFMDSYNCENEVDVGIQKMKDYLKFKDDRPMDSVNFPLLQVKSNCRNIIRSLERWSRDPISLKPDALSPYKDHFDVVRYACMAGLHVDSPIFIPERKPIYALGR